MNIGLFLPFIVLIGAMFLMTRSAKKKQQAAAQMREHMQPGTGIRTIGGMYATVKEVRDDTILVEATPGFHAVFAKNAVGAVLDDEEYHRIVHGTGDDLKIDGAVVPDDASSLTDDEDEADKTDETDEPRIDLGKKDATVEADATDATTEAKAEDAGTDTGAVEDGKPREGKAEGDTDAK